MNVTADVLAAVLTPLVFALILGGYAIEYRLLRDTEEADPALPLSALPLD